MLRRAGICTAMARGALDIQPFDDSQLRAVSYVVRLGCRFRRWTSGHEVVVLWAPNAAAHALDDVEEAVHFLIEPGEFILAVTRESLRLGSGLVGTISPLSHVARFGLSVTGGADLINPGHGAEGPAALTLELRNLNPRPLMLTAGMPIAHLRLQPLPHDEGLPRTRSIYEGKDPLAGPMLYEEWQPLIGEGP